MCCEDCLVLFASCYVYTAVTKADAPIKAEPKSETVIINNININQQITIIDAAPYYYKIEYMPLDSDEPVTGWISKRSVMLNPSESDTSEYKPE